MFTESKLDFKALNANKNLAARSYWSDRMAGFEFAGYFDAGYKAVTSGVLKNYDQYSLLAPDYVAEGLKTIAGTDKARHVVLLLTIGILAQKCCSIEDIVIFTPMYQDKYSSEDDNNIVPVRMSNFSGMDVVSLLNALKDDLARDFQYGNYPIEKILAQVNCPLEELPAIGMLIDGIQDKSAFNKIAPELIFSFEIHDRLILDIQYNVNKFDNQHIAQIAQLCFHLLFSLMNNWQKRINEIEMIPENEKRRIIDEFNRTHKPFPDTRTILDFFAEQVNKRPDHVAVQFGERRLTYQELNSRANRVANYLGKHVQGKGVIVGVKLERSLEMIIAIYGILKAGCVYLPLTKDYPVERARYVLKNSNVKVVFTDVQISDIEPEEFECVHVNETLSFSDEEINLARPEDIAYIIYTSGSTGNPKGVLIKHRSVTNRLNWMQNQYALDERDVILQKTPIVFDVSVWELFWMCFNGARLVLAAPGSEKDPNEICKTIESCEVTVLHFVPSMLNMMLIFLKENKFQYAFPSLKHVFCSGEALNAVDAQSFLAHYPKTKLHNLYGPTEATVDVSFHEVDPSWSYKRIPIGKPIDNTKLFILNKEQQLQPVGISGELFIGGENLSIGYLNQIELTNGRFIKNPLDCSSVLYRTGDSARWMPDGSIEFLGRIDNQVKIRGNRIELEEIEHALKSFHSIKNAVVITKESNGTLQLVGYLVINTHFSEKEMRIFLKSTIPEYMIPGYFIIVESIPITINGKVDKKKLLSLQRPASVYVAASSDLEIALETQWKNVLGIEQASINDNFFRIGGDSILAVRLIGSINNALSISVSMNDLYQNDTIAALAKFIELSRFNDFSNERAILEEQLEEFSQAYLADHKNDLIEAVYPMSDIEKAMCFIHKSRPEDILYFEQLMQPIAYEKLDVGVLQKTVNLLVRKHAILRTGFDMDKFAHIVYKDVKTDILFHDYSGFSYEEQKHKIEANLEESRNKHFDLGSTPLWRIILYKLRDSHHEILFEYHHAILDGWSFASLLTELNNTYGVLLRDEYTDPGWLKSSFKDYIIQELHQKRNQETLEFWKNELKDYKKLKLSRQTGPKIFKSVREVYPVKVLRDVEEAARRLNTTVKNILLAAYVYSMKVLSCENDILVGLVTFTRPLKEDGEKLLGCFLNTIPFRIKIPVKITWSEYVKMIDKKILEVKKYEHLSLFEINQAIDARNYGGNPLFDTVFNFINWHVREDIKFEQMGDQEISRVEFDTFLRGNTFFDVNYDVNKERIYCMHEYSSPFMTEEKFVEYTENFNSIITHICDAPHEIANQQEIFWRKVAEKTNAQLQVAAQGSFPKVLAPASYHQEGVWLDILKSGSLYENGVSYYNIPLIIDFNEMPDVVLLETSIRSVIRNHEILRTRFIAIDGNLFQEVKEDFDFKLSLNDAGAGVDELVSRMIGIPFRLDELLVRGTLIKSQPGVYRLVVCFHNIIVDRYSVELLTKEILSIYYFSLKGHAVEPAERVFQYSEFSLWQRETLSDMEAYLLSYWKSHLGNEPKPFKLQTDRPRIPNPVYNSGLQDISIPKDLVEKIYEYEGQSGIGSGIILLAAFKILLHKYSSQGEIIIGVGVNNRKQYLNDLVGPVANFIVVNSLVSGDSSFKEYVLVLNEIYTTNLKYQAFPIDLLQKEMALGRYIGDDQLFDIVFEYEEKKSPLPEIEALGVQSLETNLGFGKYDLNFFLQKLREGIQGKLVFNANYYDSSTIAYFADHYYILLRRLLSEADSPLTAISITTEDETQRFLYGFNDTARHYPEDETVISLFERQVERTPQSIGLIYCDERVSYGALKKKADQIATYLRDTMGVKRGDLVGLMLEREACLVPCILGILKAGAAYVPIDTSYPPGRIKSIIEGSGLNVVITRAVYWDASINAKQEIVDLDKSIGDIYAYETQPCAELNGSDLAYVIYTSGSTGMPKGVMIEHKMLVNYIRWAAGYYIENEECSFPLYSSISFDLTITSIFAPLITGNQIVVYREDESSSLIEKVIKENKTDIVKLTPSHLKIIRDSGFLNSLSGSRIRKFIVGGEELETQLAKDIYEKFEGNVKIYNEYGPTEATVGCMIHRFEPASTGYAVPMGSPISNTQIYILDKNLLPVPIGVMGEIYISGDGVARGYLFDEELTAEKFIENPFIEGKRIYKTGDYAKRLPDGNVVFLGRIDEQVKIRGFRIELEEIESQLLRHEGVKECVVLAKEKQGNKYLVAYYLSNEEIQPVEIRNFLSGKLPQYMIPSWFVRLERLPLTSNGKLDKKALPDPEFTEEEKYVAPSNAIEQSLVGIWADVLEIEDPGINNNFFELGGHSLLAIGITSAIRKELELEVSVGALFQFPTIKTLAEFIQIQLNNKEKDPAPSDNGEEFELINADLVLGGYYGLSSAQKRLYFLYEFDRDSLAYNLPQVVGLKGDLDSQRLSEAFKALILRHESLRTSFEIMKEEPMQKVWDRVDFEVENFKCNEQAQRQSIIKGFIRPFDLSRAPLLRVGLIEAGPGDHILMVDMHHIITDGVSQAVLVKDFMALYANEQLPALKTQYKDYAQWQQKQEQQSRIARQRGFWLNEFSEQVTVLELPTDFARPSVKSHEGSSVRFTISIEQTRRLKQIGDSEGATMFMVILSAYNILLAKLGNQEDIVVGVPTAGRQYGDWEGIIGMFVNTLPIRNHAEGSLTFREFLREVKTKTLSCFDNQAYQYEDLIDELKLLRDTSRNPLFDVMFSYENFEESILDIPGLRLEAYSTGYEVSKFDLTLSVLEAEDRMHLDFGYCSALFKKETIQRFIGYFNKIITAITTNVNTRLFDIEVLSQQEKHKLLYELNTTGTYPKDETLVTLFEKQVEQTPENIALIFEEEELSYRELNEQANQLAHYLRDNGVQQQDIVALLTDRSIHMVVGIIAILKAGAAYMPIDIDYPRERIKYFLEDSGAGTLLTSQQYLDGISYEGKIICFEEKSITATRTSNPPIINKPEDLCYIIYTSGTTGSPKGVMVEHRNVVRLFFNDKFQFDFSATDVWTMFHSHCFDFSVWEMYGALLYGGKLIVIPKIVSKDPSRYLRVLKEKEVTILNQTPSAFYNLISADLEDKKGALKLKYVIFGGEALKPIRLKSWFKKYPDTKLINMFGITETTVHVTYKQIGENEIEHNVRNIGKPIPTLYIRIMDKHLKLIPPGVYGELFVGGAGVSRGYLKRDALTNERFIEDPYNLNERLYRTGDLARLMDTGELEYLGRRDSQVKIRGFRIELEEIENQLLKHFQVKEAIVVDKQDNEGNAFLCAYIVAHEALSSSEIRAQLSCILPDYMIPSYIMFLEKIPQTSNGKVDKRMLPEPQATQEEDYLAPRNEMEEMVAGIWANVLGIEKLNSNSNFFSLGGNSMIAIRLINAINKRLNVKASIADLFANPTIGALSVCLKKSGSFSEEVNLLKQIREELVEKKNFFLSASNIADPDNIEDVYPASDIQDGMIFHSLKEPGIYHDQMVHIARYPKIDTDTLNRALELMIKKHSILRTAFYQYEVELLQIVFKEIAPHSTHYDISDKKETEQFEIIKTHLANDKNSPFEIERPGLWRFMTFTLNDTTCCICFVCHHAIMDGWSDASFNTELNNIFIALLKDPGFKPVSLQSSYKDFVIDQIALTRDSEVITFWKHELTEYKRFSFASVDKGRAFRTRQETLPEELYTALRAKALRDNVSVKHICFSAFLYALKMLSYDDDITVGLITNNRPVVEDGDKILGCFLNTLPFRIKIPGRISWSDYLLMVDEKLNRLKKYEKLSLSKIVQIIEEPHGMRNPITDVIFNYIDFHVYEELELNEWRPSGDEEDQKRIEDFMQSLDQIQDNFLFSFTVDETGGNFVYSASYLTSFITEACTDEFNFYFRQVLSLMVNEPDALINSAGIIPERILNKLVYEFNNVRSETDTLIELFERQVSACPINTAVICGNKTLSYRELNAKANQLAWYLIENYSILPEDKIGILINRSEEMITVLLGILKSGAAYVPIDPDYPLERINYILNDSGIKLVITDSDEINKTQGLAVPFVTVDADVLSTYSNRNPLLRILHNHLAYVIYTSGSTGLPKGVMVEHGSLVDYVDSFKTYFAVSETDVVIQQSSLSFDTTVEEIYPILCSGGRLIVLRKGGRDIEDLLDKIETEKATLLSTTPLVLNEINQQAARLKSLRAIISGGDELKAAYITGLDPIPVYNTYGPTESTVCASFNKVNSLAETDIIGKPFANRSIYILNQQLQLVPVGVPGEIAIAGKGLARGYLNNAALTAEKFIKNPFNPVERLYLTGDLGRWTSDGKVQFLGRIDDQVKIRGFRIEPGEIANILGDHDLVTGSLVLAKEKEGNKYLVAYYTSENEIEVSELRNYLSARLPDYMLPAYYVYLKSMPLTVNGKVNRSALPEASIKAARSYTGPSNEMEEKLIGIWSEILKMDKELISTNQSFFELGGHSLRATVLVNRIFKEFNVEIPLSKIFKYQEISSLSEFIREVKDADYSADLVLGGYYGLSSAQKRLYFLYEFDRDSLAYNLPQVVGLKGDLDGQRLSEAFKALILRHESLRTSFEIMKEEPMQKVWDRVDFEVENFKCSEQAQRQSIIKGFIRPFDLSRAPLLRVGLIEAGPGDHILMVDMHHIITDGVSQAVLVKDFMALYANEQLPALKTQYKDYAQWQQKQEQQSRIARQRGFWLNEFSEQATVLELPTDFARPSVKSHEGSSVRFTISIEQTRRLKQIGDSEGATMFMVILSAYNILLAKLGNQEDIVVGVPTAGRQYGDWEGIIGMFVNTLPIRNHAEGSLTFREFLREVKTKTLSCFDNQAYQYEDLIDELKLLRDTSRNPLFDVMFSYENFEESILDIPGLRLEAYSTGYEVSKFDLTLSVLEAEDRMHLDFGYCSALFKKETIQRFIGYFNKIITAITTNVNTRLFDIEVLSQQEKHKLLYELNTTGTYPKDETLVTLFEKQVEQTPDNIALIFEEEELSYRELNEQANQLAHYLRDNGVQQQDIVALLTDRSMHMVVGIIAILKAGAAYMPIDILHPLNRILQVLDDSKAPFLLTDVYTKERYSKSVHVIDVLNNEICNKDKTSLGLPLLPENIAYIIHTSGSTGKPKGVMIRHRSVVNLIECQRKLFRINEEDKILQFSNICFDASVEQMWLALLSGSALVLISQQVIGDNARFNDYIVQHKITHLHAVPSFLENMELKNQNSLKRIVSGGEECRLQLANKFCRKYKFYNEYGPTETTVTSAICLVTERDIKKTRIPIGKPVNNTWIYVLGRHMELLSEGAKGEIFIGGAGLAKGYLNDEITTEEKFLESPFLQGQLIYRTGDLGRWLPNGDIEYLGRIDNQVKIRGFRIEPGEIEAHLSSHSKIKEAVVLTGERHDDKYLIAYYVSDREIEADELGRYLSDRLPAYMQPSYYFWLKAFPLTTNGKLNRKDLPRPEIRADEYEAPSNATEIKLVEIWSEILKLEANTISVNKSFFHLGGHSLGATKLVFLIQKEFQCEVSLIDVFKSSTIKELSRKLQHKKSIIQNNELLALLKQNPDTKDNLFFIHDISGDIQAYVELSGLINQYNCWGIRSALLRQYNPEPIEVREIAKQYIGIMKATQPAGPYRIAGWSFGGIIAYEMVRQLESEGDMVDALLMIDSGFPFLDAEEEHSKEAGFPLAEERILISELLGLKPAILETVDTLQMLWEQAILFFKQSKTDLAVIKTKIPDEIRSLIPAFNELGFEDLMVYINAVRSWEAAAAKYQIKNRLKAQLIYIKASKGNSIIEPFAAYFETDMVVRSISGDHFTILKQPHVYDLAFQVERELQNLAQLV